MYCNYLPFVPWYTGKNKIRGYCQSVPGKVSHIHIPGILRQPVTYTFLFIKNEFIVGALFCKPIFKNLKSISCLSFHMNIYDYIYFLVL